LINLIYKCVFDHFIPEAKNSYMDRLDETIDQHLGEPAFGNEKIAENIASSTQHLFRKA